ncbi:MAG: MFS transporter [Dehalococcoidales bacterium]|nr:MFS transporter [Dehalococcoidales bacterium]
MVPQLQGAGFSKARGYDILYIDAMLDGLGATRRRFQGIFFGWWIVLSSCVINALNRGFLNQGFTVYFLPLQAEFGWSRALLSTGYSLGHVESGILDPFQGWISDRFGPRRVILIGVILLGGGFIMLSMVQSIVAFFAAFLLLSIGSGFCGNLSFMVAIFNWFVRKRSLTLGIALAGGALGGVIVPAIAWSLTTHGWRVTALASGFIIWIIGIPLALLVRHKPEQYGYLPDGDRPARSEEHLQEHPSASPVPQDKSQEDDSFSAREALKSRAFWLIASGHALAILTVSAVSLHLAPHLVQQLGMSLEAAGSIVALLSVFSVVGRVVGGFLADRIQKRVLLVICMLSHSIGLFILTYAISMGQVILFTIFHGIAWGIRAVTQNAIRAEYFGRNSIGLILGISNVFSTTAQVSAPIFAGWLADIYGDYRLAFTILTVLTAFGSLFFGFAGKPVRKSQARM